MPNYNSGDNISEFDDFEDDPLPIKEFLLTDKEIKGVFPELGEKDIVKLKEILSSLTEKFYNYGKR